jgi:hypothetical protein
MKWTNTIEVAGEVERAGAKGQWQIGDAIYKDLKENKALDSRQRAVPAGAPPKIKGASLKPCADVLAAKGIEHKGKPYTIKYLHDLFRTAWCFDDDERNPKYSWDIHQDAGHPTNLKKAITALHKTGEPVTRANVRSVMKLWREEATRKRKQKLTTARNTKEKAKADKVKATKDRLAAKDDTARNEAERRRQQAIKEIETAKKEMAANIGAPPFNAELKVDVTDVNALERLAVYMVVGARATRMMKLAEATLADISKVSKALTAAEQQGIADGCDAIISILNNIKEIVERPTSRLVVHRGGAA